MCYFFRNISNVRHSPETNKKSINFGLSVTFLIFPFQLSYKCEFNLLSMKLFKEYKPYKTSFIYRDTVSIKGKKYKALYMVNKE